MLRKELLLILPLVVAVTVSQTNIYDGGYEYHGTSNVRDQRPQPIYGNRQLVLPERPMPAPGPVAAVPAPAPAAPAPATPAPAAPAPATPAPAAPAPAAPAPAAPPAPPALPPRPLYLPRYNRPILTPRPIRPIVAPQPPVTEGAIQPEVEQPQPIPIPAENVRPEKDEEPAVEVEPLPAPVPQPKPMPEPIPVLRPKPVLLPEPMPQPKPLVEHEPMPQPKPLVEPEPMPQPKPVLQPKPILEPEPMPQPKPIPIPEPEPIIKPEPLPQPRPVRVTDPMPPPKPIEEPVPIPQPKPVELPKPVLQPKPIVLPEPLPQPKPIPTPDPIAERELRLQSESTPFPAFIPNPVELTPKPEPIPNLELTPKPEPIPNPELTPKPEPTPPPKPTQGTTILKESDYGEFTPGLQMEPEPVHELVDSPPGTLRYVELPDRNKPVALPPLLPKPEPDREPAFGRHPQPGPGPDVHDYKIPEPISHVHDYTVPDWIQVDGSTPTPPHVHVQPAPVEIPVQPHRATTSIYDPQELDFDFHCTAPYAYYPIEHECDTFIGCKQSQPYKFTCPDGLHFNPAAKSTDFPCAYPSEVKCMAGAEKQNPKPTETCPNQYGYYSMNDGDCSKFIMCQEGAATVMDCPQGLVFNEHSSTCDWPANVPQCNPNVFKDFTCPEPPKDEYGQISDIIYKYRYGQQCKQYIACQLGRPRLLSCDRGLSFDEASQSCVDEDYVTDCAVPYLRELH